jgi:hypothetical protein
LPEALLHLRGKTGAVGVGQNLHVRLEERTRRLDRLGFGQQLGEEPHHAPRAAEVAVRAQADPARQGHFRQAIEVLHRVLEPEDAGILAPMTEDQVPPLHAEVLPLVDDHGVEQPVGADRPRGGVLDEPVERPGPVEVRRHAVIAQKLVAQHVQGRGHATARGDLREVVRQRAG